MNCLLILKEIALTSSWNALTSSVAALTVTLRSLLLTSKARYKKAAILLTSGATVSEMNDSLACS